MLEYLDFEVKIERRRGREYIASVIKSPAGEASGTFILPFTPRQLKDIRETIEIALVRSMMPVRRAVPPEFEKVEKFGRELYVALFKDDVKSCYDRSSTVAFGEGKGLRLKLRLDPTLTNLPWEFMYSQEMRDYLALCRTIPPVRYTELPQPAVPLKVTPPLRILVVIASPSGYAPLNVEHEKERITSALKELQERGIIKVEFLEAKNTLAALQRMLRRADYHVLHFIGHGDYDEEAEEGLLLMEDARGRGRSVSGQWLGRLLRGYFPMRLVVLNACEGALTSSSDPFAGVAAAVVGAGVPAVVAMQFEISDEAAIIFSREFYSALADNFPVDAAVTEARMAIVHSRENTIEWGTPVLYMRALDGMLFTVAPVGERVAVAPKEAIKLEEERLAALYAEAHELLQAEDWSGAIARCGDILALDPTYRDAASLLVKAKQGLDLQERRRAREERLSDLYSEGIRWLEEGRWREAIDEFKQVLVLEEGYRDAAARLATAEEKVAKAEAERERQRKLSNLYEQGVAALRAQQWQKAVALLEQVQAMESGYRDTTSLLDRAQREMARLREEQLRDEQLSALYGEGVDFFNEGHWQQAIARFQQVVDLEEGYKDSAAKLGAAQEQLAKAVAERERRKRLAALYEQAVAAVESSPWRVATIGAAALLVVLVGIATANWDRLWPLLAPTTLVKVTATLPVAPTPTTALPPSTPTPAPPTPIVAEVTIKNLRDGDPVDRLQPVSVEYRGLAKGSEIYIVVELSGNEWWPKKHVEVGDSGAGNWISEVQFEDVDRQGIEQPFDLLVVVAEDERTQWVLSDAAATRSGIDRSEVPGPKVVQRIKVTFEPLAEVTWLESGESIEEDLDEGEGKHYAISVPSGYELLEVELEGPKETNFELFVKRGSPATTEIYDESSEQRGSEEAICIDAPSGEYYITVVSLTGSGGFSLRATSHKTRPAAAFGEIIMAEDVEMIGDNNFEPINPRTDFPAGTIRVYAVWKYEGMYDGAVWTRMWLREGEVVFRKTQPWKWGESGIRTWTSSREDGLASGNHEFRLFICSELVQTAPFTVGGGLR